jgi:anti-sigma factor RsiW
MKYEDSHLSDQQLILDVEGELSSQDEKMVRSHLDACRQCRARRQEFENAITGFVRAHQREFAKIIPPADGPRALLRARLSQISEAGHGWRWDWFSIGYGFASAVAAGGLLVFVLLLVHSRIERRAAPLESAVFSLPDSTLTPGATILADRRMVCAQEGANNKAVPAALQRKVFEEYRIEGADPRAYEVDYLVTPALGGADDIRNLWPHSYSATVWNAHVKDALEERLRHMVCEGDLDLSEAQQEIAANWIGAYKKYFQTDEPLAEHRKQPVP